MLFINNFLIPTPNGEFYIIIYMADFHFTGKQFKEMGWDEEEMDLKEFEDYFMK